MTNSQAVAIEALASVGIDTHPEGDGVYVVGHGRLSVGGAVTLAMQKETELASTPGTAAYRQHVESLGQQRIPGVGEGE